MLLFGNRASYFVIAKATQIKFFQFAMTALKTSSVHDTFLKILVAASFSLCVFKKTQTKACDYPEKNILCRVQRCLILNVTTKLLQVSDKF